MSEARANSNKTDEVEAAAVSAENSDPLVGTRFGTRFEIISKLGTGATGATYKAIDNLLQREVALKILHQHLLSSPEAIERFKKEAVTSTALSHPNICRVYSQGSEEGRLYTVMDCLDGESLSTILARDGKLELEIFFSLFRQIIDALEYAHQKQLIHRDIKPGNIIVVSKDNQKQAVLVDFGLAKFIDQSAGQDATKTGVLMGSSAYMSPEQCTGAKDIDARSDIYSLGCVMLEALIGKTPFQGESALDTMYKHLNESLGQLGFLKQLPEALSNLINKCLQKDAAARYQNIDELRRDFEKCQSMEDTLKRRMLQNQKPGTDLTSRFLKVCVLLLAGLAFAGIAYLKESQKNSKVKEEVLANMSANKPLPPPESVPLSFRRSDIHKLLDRYADRNRGLQGISDAMIVIERWEKERAAKAPPSDLDGAYLEFICFFAMRNDHEHCEYYARKLFARPDAQSDYATMAISQVFDHYLRTAEYQKGIEFINKTASEFPHLQERYATRVAIHGALANCYEGLKQNDKALEHLLEVYRLSQAETSVPQFSDNSWRNALLSLLIRTGKRADLINPIINASIESCGNDDGLKAEAHWQLGCALQGAQAYSAAEKQFQIAMGLFKLIKKKSRVLDCALMRAQLCSTKRKFDEAEKLYTEIISQNDDPTNRLQAFNCLTADCCYIHDLKKANRYADGAVQEAEKRLAVRGKSLWMERDLWIETAIWQKYSLIKNGSNEKAIAFLQEWIKKVKQSTGNSLLLARLYTKCGTQLAFAKQPEAALHCATEAKAILEQPNSIELMKSLWLDPHEQMAEILAVRTQAYTYGAQSEKALIAAREALNEQKLATSRDYDKLASYRVMLAACLDARQENPDEQKALLNQLENTWLKNQLKHPSWSIETADQVRRFADILAHTGEHKKAEQLYAECILRMSKEYNGPDSIPLWFYCGHATQLLALNRPAELIAPLERSLDLFLHTEQASDSKVWHAVALDCLWQACKKTGDKASAKKYLEAEIPLSPDKRKAELKKELAKL